MHGAHTQLFPKCNQVTCCPFLGELQVYTTMQHHSFRTTISAGSVLSSCTAMIAVMCPFGLLPNIYLFLFFFQHNSHYHCHQLLHHHHQDCEHHDGSKKFDNYCNLSMPNHAMQPHHHHHIQTTNPKKEKQWVTHTHIPISSERTEHKPRTTWICYQDHLLCQHVCVTVCVCESKLR